MGLFSEAPKRNTLKSRVAKLKRQESKLKAKAALKAEAEKLKKSIAALRKKG